MERRSGEWDLRSEKCELVDTERLGALWKGRQWGDALRDAVGWVRGERVWQAHIILHVRIILRQRK